MLRAKPRFRRLSRGQLARRINPPLSSVGPGARWSAEVSGARTNAARQTADVGVIKVCPSRLSSFGQLFRCAGADDRAVPR